MIVLIPRINTSYIKQKDESIERLNEIWGQKVSKINVYDEIKKIADKKNIIWKILESNRKRPLRMPKRRYKSKKYLKDI